MGKLYRNWLLENSDTFFTSTVKQSVREGTYRLQFTGTGISERLAYNYFVN